MGLQQIKAAT